jgi:DNA mismatch endonuclease (patch repair protein)
MRGNRRRDTSLELAIRRELHRRGYRFRVDFAASSNKRLRADIVFTRRRLAVYLDGCFWHGCPDHYTRPVANREFWDEKVANNRARDVRTNEVLGAEGWAVVRFWEHESPDQVVSEIERILGSSPTL